MLFSVNAISGEIPGRSRRFPRSQNKIPPCPHKKLPPFHSGVLLGWGWITPFRNSISNNMSNFSFCFCIVKLLQILTLTESIETFLKTLKRGVEGERFLPDLNGTFCKICCYTFSNKWRTLYSDCILTKPAKEGLLKQ